MERKRVGAIVLEDWRKFISELKSKNDIVDVIGGYIPVTQKGRSFWAPCPFHHEKMPSFNISRVGQFYKCFGCNVSGDVIKFVQEYENIDFMQAVEMLANRVGMTVPSRADEEGEKRIRETKAKRERLMAALKAAALYYHKALYTESGKECREYIKKRGFSDSIAKSFGLGYSPDNYSIVSYLASKGIDKEDALEAGVLEGNAQKGYYDAMSGRLIIPIIGAMREVLGFGGRALFTKSGYAKYKNTKQTAIFEKSNTLYNINKVKKLRQEGKLQRLVLVEGYMDVIGLANGGVDSVVASMGTSLTRGQAKLIKRYTDEVYICYDGDSAGQGATLRGLDILRDESLTVNVMTMPEDIDPDEFVAERGAEAFNEIIRSARPLCDYKLFNLKRKFDLVAEDYAERERNRLAYTKSALVIISETHDAVEKEKLIMTLSADTGFNESFIRDNVTKEKATAFVVPKSEADMLTKAKACIAAAAMADVDYAEDYYPDEKEGTIAFKVFEYIKNCKQKGKKAQLSELFDIVGEADWLMTEIADLSFEGKTYEKQYYIDCLKRLKLNEIENEIERISKKAENADNEERIGYLALMRGLIDKKRSIQNGGK